METEANKALVHRLFERLINRRKVDAIEELYGTANKSRT